MNLSNQRFGQYRIIEQIGRGGMAMVYRALQISTNRDVAIKVLPSQFMQDEMFLERFIREAQLVAGLQHPHIVPVYDYGEQDGLPYIVMALMSGGTLRDRIGDHPGGMPVDTAFGYIDQICRGLDYAHRQGIIHRDFKPGNVLFDNDNNAYLADFGIAKATAMTAALTGTGAVGTPAYMAPELADKAEPTMLVDIYAVGITLYQMLTGELPFDASTPMGTMMAHVTKPVPDIRAARPDLSDDMQYVIERVLAKNPALRYQTTGELVHNFKLALSDGIPYKMDLDAITEAVDLNGQAASSADPMRAVREADPDSAEAVQRPARKRSGALVGIAAGILTVAAVIAGVALVVTDTLPLGGQAAEQPEAAAAPPTDTAEPAPVIAIQDAANPTPVTLAPMLRVLADPVERQKGSDVFSDFSGEDIFAVDDFVRTGGEGAALIGLAENSFVEVHPDTMLSLDRFEMEDDILHIVLRQFSGLSYFSINPGEAYALDLTIFTPNASIAVTGTRFWVVEEEGGWCFKLIDGDFRIDTGGGQAISLSFEDDPFLVPFEGSNQTVCVTDFDTLISYVEGGVDVVEITPTTGASAGSGEGTDSGGDADCGDGVCTAGAENSDLCPADCGCVDDGAAGPGEGCNCRDVLCEGESAGTVCGAPCSDACGGGLACVNGICWDATVCGGGSKGGGGGGGGGEGCQPVSCSPNPGTGCNCNYFTGICEQQGYDCVDSCGASWWTCSP